jgi:hypothetical protein
MWCGRGLREGWGVDRLGNLIVCNIIDITLPISHQSYLGIYLANSPVTKSSYNPPTTIMINARTTDTISTKKDTS